MVHVATGPRELPTDPSERFEFWAAGIPHELRFWTDWARTKGGRWPDEFAKRMNPATPLAPWILGQALKASLNHIRILDVGAGPVTSLGYVPPKGMTMELIAIDPLAGAYAQEFGALGLTPPVTTQFALAEELSAFLPAESFDIVHCRQAIDCCFDPLRGLTEMLRLIKPGGVMMLYHMPNQAEAAGYVGLRQYNLEVEDERHHMPNQAEAAGYVGLRQCNLEVEDDRLVIWRGAERWDVQTALPVRTRLRANNRGQVSVIIEKREAFPPERPGWFKLRLGEAWKSRVNLAIQRTTSGEGPSQDRGIAMA
jgi:SAM-dependent methyltransferase